MRDIKLSSLRVCLEVLRRENLTAAAQALNMTQSAVSKSVQLVEAQLGIPLFRRGKSGVIPHDYTRAFLSRIAEGVDTIDAALGELVAHEGCDTLRIMAPPIITQRFVIPHLDTLKQAHPGVELVFRARTPQAVRQADVDAEILFSGTGTAPPGAQWLTGDCFWVVAHPALAAAPLMLAQVAEHPLLQHVMFERAWSGLVERTGLNVAMTRFHHYEQYALIIDAVLQKMGVAIVPRFLIQDHVMTGQLQRIGEDIVFPRVGYYYRLIRREKAAASRGFYQWLQDILQQADTA
jgi:LysR family glycine cleavage system transcriptional activator